ncbi:TraX family protein [Paenibacillus guangzhouensis]|uniref:TraX family protein n=1 Tax=Paenibacillus guangzhouensis TaxID=1473112 RepID=UPI0012675B22|nr:TraX family protein [Paenibacillus guangzhouensis]
MQHLKLNAFQLKLIAMLFMVFDHIHQFIPGMPMWLNYVGRLVSPIFFYFVVEGFFHTRNRMRYARRLFSWAVVMFCGSQWLTWCFPQSPPIHNNIFLSLALAVVMMMGMEWAKWNRKGMYIGLPLAVVAIAVAFFYSEASLYGIAMTFVFYFCRDRKGLLALVYGIVSLVLTIGLRMEISYEALLLHDAQWMMIFAIIPILMYSGERGPNTKFAKYMFYTFYPVHIWILFIIGYFAKLNGALG